MPRRKTKTRSVFITKEPEWKTLKLLTDVAEREKAFKECEYFVRTEIKSKQTVAAAKNWIKNKSEWDKEDIKLILANPDWAFTACGTSFFIEAKLGYLSEGFKKHLEKRKLEWITRGKTAILEKKEKQEKKQVKIVTIKDRMQEQITDLLGDFEAYLDDFISGDKTVKDFDPYKMMLSYQPAVKANHAKLIAESYECAKAEAKEVVEWQDEDIKEGYNFMTVKMRKDYLAFFEKIETACDTVINQAKSNRKARKPRARSKDSIIKKLKYLEAFGELGLASVAPTDIVNCNELWVYNTKNRKIGVYHATSKDPKAMNRPGAGLMVKGTPIQDFDEKESVQKTLRKPAEQISNWTGKAKTKFAKSFDELTTTGTKMNGRINEHTILLTTF
jgi:hypothetical protein